MVEEKKSEQEDGRASEHDMVEPVLTNPAAGPKGEQKVDVAEEITESVPGNDPLNTTDALDTSVQASTQPVKHAVETQNCEDADSKEEKKEEPLIDGLRRL